MLDLFQNEWSRLRTAISSLDRQTTFVLVFAAVAVVLQFILGDRGLFYEHVAASLPADWRELASWGWWFGMQGLLGFVLPAAGLLLFFSNDLEDAGLGLGNWRLATGIAALYLPLVAVGTWVLSDGSAFQQQYPHYSPASQNWTLFLIYEALFLFYWLGWEYLWRGFVLFGSAPTLGLYAIFVQAIPFAALHVSKPWPEALLSIVGGIALGALVWRCRSFWIAVPIHAAQMMLLDFWCTLRVRTGVSGVGLEAFAQLVSHLGR
ncbi:abortive infection protein [Salinibacter sp. 10B]|uniref:CPBP family intramembrane glutamic endopeptidase n=1 Tax=Salinibacter sp. 10B TaxID=1923971 RepID=UPI000CF4D5D9|nr:CPBP family intramembrane glutamic endopeptidase [Salinibacter sp. 10B]PQJ36119.1 abortive infection protein [Salinibacter sp. 10B]